MTELVEVERSGATLRATDVAGNTILFDVTGWESSVDPASFDDPIDALAAGRVSSIRYDLGNQIRIDRLDGDLDVGEAATSYTDLKIDVEDAVAYDLPDGEYRCKIEENFFVDLHIEGAVELTKRPFAPLVFSFPHPTPVTFGFRTMVDFPSHELTVEPTVEGIATALSHLPSALKTTGPNRVHRNYRRYPPRVSVGEETIIPDAVRESTPETGIELLVPDRLDAVFAAASLTYFTGATVRPGDVTTPRLRADAVGLERELSPLAREGPELLRRTFFLELLVSWLGSESITLIEHEQLADAGITLEECEGASLAERLNTYLHFPTEPVEKILPSWPYRVTVEPRPDLAPVLPHLLHDLAAVTPPGDDSRGDDSKNLTNLTGDPLSKLRAARHLDGGVGETGGGPDFTATPTAYSNRLRHLDGGSDTLRVVVVVPDGHGEFGEALRERYSRRNENRSLLVDVLVAPTRDELAATLEHGAQFVHYLGDCSDGTLACRDDSLDPTAATENNVELFVLDAPDANAVAETLVATGSVACTTRHINTGTGDADSSTDLGAVDASAMLGELLLYGQCFGSAANNSTALGGIPVDTVVGDASHRFIPQWNPSPIWHFDETAGSLDVTIVSFPVDPVGTQWITELDSEKQFMPAIFEETVDPEALVPLIHNNQSPLYFDGRLYWGDDRKQLVYPIA